MASRYHCLHVAFGSTVWRRLSSTFILLYSSESSGVARHACAIRAGAWTPFGFAIMRAAMSLVPLDRTLPRIDEDQGSIAVN